MIKQGRAALVILVVLHHVAVVYGRNRTSSSMSKSLLPSYLRIGIFILALASVLFVLFAGYWNMLGWRF
jgi:hypothetical protein